MFSYSKGYYVSPPDDQYLKFKNRCSLIAMHLIDVNVQTMPPLPLLPDFTAVIAKNKLGLFYL
jgi:hypothetical protein